MQQSIEVEVNAAPERVWEVLCDVERWPEWTETVTAVTRLDTDTDADADANANANAGRLGLGSRVRVEQPKLPPTEYVVTELDPGRSFTWVATGPGVRTTARHGIEARAGGASRVRLSVEQAGPLGVVMGRLFFRGLTDRYLAAEAAGLKARCEGGR